MESLADRLKSPRAWARDVAIAAAMAVFFALIGPFGSYADSLPKRFAYCAAYAFGGLPIWGPGFRVLLWLGDRWRWPVLVSRPVAALLITVPVTLAVRLVAGLFWPQGSPPDLLSIYLKVNTIAVPIALVVTLLPRASPPSSPPVAAEGSRPPRLLARLPAAIEAPVVALQAEDHYVRVHTERGSTLLLMRFADAVAELDGLPGLQVHRSWWVARAAVTGATRSGRRAEILLKTGLSAPVSRAAMAQARAEGYLGVRA